MDERAVPDSLDLVLDVQFFTLEFRNLKVVCGGVGERFVDFLFERLVSFFELRKMRFNRHVACLLASDLSLIGSSYTLTTETKILRFSPTEHPPKSYLLCRLCTIVGAPRGLVGDQPKRDNL